MREIKVETSKDPVTSNILIAVQLRTVNDPWLPRLWNFECWGATGDLIPFIPLFISPETTEVYIEFDEDAPLVGVASIISRFPTLCPALESIALPDLQRHPIITEAVSEMFLAYNRDNLRVFYVHSPLTDEAREVVFRLPGLAGLWVIIQEPVSLPTALPNLDSLERRSKSWRLPSPSSRLIPIAWVTSSERSRALRSLSPTFQALGIRTILLSLRSPN